MALSSDDDWLEDEETKVTAVEHDTFDEDDPTFNGVEPEVMSEINILASQPNPWADSDPNRKLQFLDIKSTLKRSLKRPLTSQEKDAIRARLKPLETPFSSFAGSMLNIFDTDLPSPIKSSKEWTITNKDTGEQFSIDEIEHRLPIEQYSTFEAAEEVNVTITSTNTGVIFTAKHATIGRSSLRQLHAVSCFRVFIVCPILFIPVVQVQVRTQTTQMPIGTH